MGTRGVRTTPGDGGTGHPGGLCQASTSHDNQTIPITPHSSLPLSHPLPPSPTLPCAPSSALVLLLPFPLLLPCSAGTAASDGLIASCPLMSPVPLDALEGAEETLWKSDQGSHSGVSRVWTWA